MESGNPLEDHDELIELVASDETGFLSLFSQQQLQVSNTQFFTPLKNKTKSIFTLPFEFGYATCSIVGYGPEWIA